MMRTHVYQASFEPPLSRPREPGMGQSSNDAGEGLIQLPAFDEGQGIEERQRVEYVSGEAMQAIVSH